MNILSFLQTNQFQRFTAFLYGWGASLVILGALFKIQHYPGAGVLLIGGMTTEAIIFFISAFEPLHVDYDWSLVYPEFAGLEDVSKKKKKEEKKPVSLDQMLADAKIGPDLIETLGQGMRNLGENAKKMSDISNAAVASNGYVNNLNLASESVSELSNSYKKTSDNLNKNAGASDDYINSIKIASESANELSGSYKKTFNALDNNIDLFEGYANSIKAVTNSANNFVEKYTESADALTKSADALDFSKIDGSAYVENLQLISKNLSALNASYELQLQGSNDQMQTTNKLQKSIENFVSNLNESVESTVKYKEVADMLAESISDLNKVYGNMLSAMNVNR
jgi:gliding motility-associated protein GldL